MTSTPLQEAFPIKVGGPTLPQVRRLVTEIPGPRSRALLKRKTEAVPRGIGILLPVFAVAAGGGVLVDVDGNSLIDLASGIAVTTVGNADPEVVRAVATQAEKFTHTCFAVTAYESYIGVAEALNRLTPGAHAKRTALFNSGAEAVENAIKIARAYTKRSAVVALEHAYHGRTNLTMALSAKSVPFKSGFGPFAPEIYRAPTSYPYRDGLSGQAAAANTIRIIESQFGSDLAAIIAEPIQGEGGFIVPAEGFLAALQAWANRNGVVFIVDEIQTGFARTGQMFACEHEGIVPDLIALGKGIAGGLPLSAVTGRAEIMEAPQVGGIGGTYTGNPIACAAALASIAHYQGGGLVERARDIGVILREELMALAGADKRIGDVRGRGAMMAIEFADPSAGQPDNILAASVLGKMHKAGVIALMAGTYNNVIRLLPPLSISDDLLREGLQVLSDAVRSA